MWADLINTYVVVNAAGGLCVMLAIGIWDVVDTLRLEGGPQW